MIRLAVPVKVIELTPEAATATPDTARLASVPLLTESVNVVVVSLAASTLPRFMAAPERTSWVVAALITTPVCAVLEDCPGAMRFKLVRLNSCAWLTLSSCTVICTAAPV